jgi:DNA-binding response OmpR family regulator
MNSETRTNNLSAVADRCAEPRRPGILVADDMGLILALFKIELELQGFDVWLAEDGAFAVDLYRRYRERIDVVLLDVNMPVLDGPQTLAGLREMNENILACFMTADWSGSPVPDLLTQGAACVFRKPFRFTEIARHLHALVDSAA